MKTLKCGEAYLKNYETFTDVLRQLPCFIEEAYNRKRLYFSMGYLTHHEFEVKLKKGGMEEPKLQAFPVQSN